MKFLVEREPVPMRKLCQRVYFNDSIGRMNALASVCVYVFLITDRCDRMKTYVSTTDSLRTNKLWNLRSYKYTSFQS